MLHTFHVVASRLRHTPLLERQRWLWDRIEPAWQRSYGFLTRRNGFLTHVNSDIFRLVYEVGARYERHDKHVYEPRIYNAWIDVIRPGRTVFDIGAHYGFFSLAASTRVGQEECEVKFYSEGTSMSASLGFSNVKDLCARHPDVVDETVVPATTVDAYCCRHSLSPDLLKIDVEGAELLVLRGAEQVLRTHHTPILCEVHPLQMANLGCTVDDLTLFVSSLGSSISKIDQPNPQGIYHAWLELSS